MSRFMILPTAFFSIGVGGVIVGVAKISATVIFEGDVVMTSVPHFEFKCWRYFAACTGAFFATGVC